MPALLQNMILRPQQCNDSYSNKRVQLPVRMNVCRHLSIPATILCMSCVAANQRFPKWAVPPLGGDGITSGDGKRQEAARAIGAVRAEGDGSGGRGRWKWALPSAFAYLRLK
jgi:hypothetical protein